MKPNRPEHISAVLALRVAALVASLLACFPVHAEDWPTWRYDVNRGAASPEKLASELQLQWRRDNRPLKPAWSEDPRLYFDAAYQPVVMDGTIFVASSHNDSVSAWDSRSGEEKWRFYVGMPVRFAPVASKGRVYFGADDGVFYCLDAATSNVQWTFKAALNDRKVIGNGRLISVWPIRGGPLLADGKVHFTAGVWPFEGTFLYSLDAATGQLVSMAREPEPLLANPGGPMVLKDRTPEGYLAAGRNRLFVPCGRTAVTCLDRRSGELIGISYSTSRATSYHVSVTDRWLFHGSMNYDMLVKQPSALGVSAPVLDDGTLYAGVKGQVVAFGLDEPKVIKSKDRRGRPVTTSTPQQLWSLADDKIRRVPRENRDKWLAANPIFVDIKAGDRLYGHYGKTVFSVDLPSDTSEPTVSWKTTLDSPPASILAADERLFVVTDRGSIHCFGPQKIEPRIYPIEKSAPSVTADVWSQRAEDLLELSGAKNAYCLVAGVGSGRLIEEIARRSDLQIIGIDSDAAKIAKLRRRLDAQGLYATRVELLVGNLPGAGLPPYLASLLVSEEPDGAGLAGGKSFAKSVFHVLRPYGGTAYLAVSADDHGPFAELVAASKLDGAEVTRQGRFSALSRVGALPGSADWTHEWGDSSNSLVSRDELVKAPLGVLWFGGPAASGELFYNRHYWGPSMAVVGGRILIQGPGKLTAVDVYTGRILWRTPLDHNEDYNPERRGNDFEKHLAGFNFLAVKDAVYLVLGRDILRIDPGDGKVVSEFSLPSETDAWGRIRVEKDLLLATVCREYQAEGKSHGKLPVELVAMNRYSGERLWVQKAYMSFPVLAVGSDKVFCYDGLLEDLYGDQRRKGRVPKSSEVKFVKALDLKTGQEVWKQMTDLPATWTGYSRRQDILMISNKTGMVAINGADGGELWRKKAEGRGFRGHPETLWDKIIIADGRIIDQRGPGFSYDLATGDPILRKHPVTNQPIEWEFTKVGHHCNYAVASPHLMTFRAAEAGFCDLASGNTSRLHGYRSGCRNSLIPANGVLNSPNFAHACVCGYPIFTSLALVHQPENEIWSYSPLTLTKEDRVERVGINFGAPGDRLDGNGTLWLDYPNVGGSSPALGLKLTGSGQRLFQNHSATVSGGDLDWVAASGVEGASSVTVTLVADPSGAAGRGYTVRLVFAEPYDLKPGQRVFDVSLQGKKVLSGFDIAQEAGSSRMVLVREFSGIQAIQELTIDLEASAGKTILGGVEIVADAPVSNVGDSR